MSTIDDTKFPIVRVTIAAPKEQNNQEQEVYFETYERLLKRAEPFIMINEVSAPDQKETKSNKAHMKKMNLWMKKNRTALASYVLAMIQVEADPMKRDLALGFQEIYQKYWGHQLLVVDSYEQALARAEEELKYVSSSIEHKNE